MPHGQGMGNLVTLLHLAILHGQRDAVKCLVKEFDADINRPFRAMERRNQSASAIPRLALALRLPLEAARDMSRLLLKLGACIMQTDNQNMTALKSCIALKPALLDTYHSADLTGVNAATCAILKRGRGPGTAVSAPLLTAIETRNTGVAFQLLHQGACATLPFEAFTGFMDTKADLDMNIMQPVILSVDGKLPLLTLALVREYGVDCNTLTPDGWKHVHGAAKRSHRPESLLDRAGGFHLTVDERRKSLEVGESGA